MVLDEESVGKSSSLRSTVEQLSAPPGEAAALGWLRLQLAAQERLLAFRKPLALPPSASSFLPTLCQIRSSVHVK